MFGQGFESPHLHKLNQILNHDIFNNNISSINSLYNYNII